MIRFSVETHGPLFNQVQRAAAVKNLETGIEDQVAGHAFEAWQRNLDRYIRVPTPYYETQTRRYRRNGWVNMDDRRIVYGPWLEGVGSRNRTTRFKGYFSLARAYHLTKRKTPLLAGKAVARWVRRMNS